MPATRRVLLLLAACLGDDEKDDDAATSAPILCPFATIHWFLFSQHLHPERQRLGALIAGREIDALSLPERRHTKDVLADEQIAIHRYYES